VAKLKTAGVGIIGTIATTLVAGRMWRSRSGLSRVERERGIFHMHRLAPEITFNVARDVPEWVFIHGFT